MNIHSLFTFAALTVSPVMVSAAPVALVEEVGQDVAGVEVLDYVSAGQSFELGPTGTLVLGYLDSCLQETITGGTVTVGELESVVSGGEVVRQQRECDGGKLALSDEQAMHSAAVAMRSPPPRDESRSSMSAPAALVEEVGQDVPGVEVLDFLSAGQSLELGPTGTLVLGYFDSCLQETITGGTVAIGKQESVVSGGEVVRQYTPCDGGALSLSAEQAMHSGAVALRGIGSGAGPVVEVFDNSPLFILPRGGRVVIKRLDVVGERHVFTVEGEQRVRLDLVSHDVHLVAGGRYMVTGGGKAAVFTVSVSATRGEVTLIGRVVVL